MINRTFDQTIYHKWTNSFGCPTDTVYQSGTTLVPESKFEDQKIIVLSYIEKHTFVQLDPFHYQELDKLVKALPQGTSITGDSIQAEWGENSIKSRDFGLTYYLRSSELPAFLPPKPFILRKLTTADAEHMDSLHKANTSADVEEGYVEVTHQIAFGCFFEGRLVSASSGYDRTGFLDIGVLTHPDFRQKGLGKAAVGAICEWANEKHIIPQYRHDVLNKGSENVAKSLNFKTYFRTEAIYFI